MDRSRTIEIMLIEDNPGDVELAKAALEELKVITRLNVFYDGRDALRYLKNEDKSRDLKHPDLILLDLNLPGKDGRELLNEIKSDDSLRRIPVVVMSSSESTDDIANAYLNHANCYIKKPINQYKFNEVVKKIQDYWISIVKLPTA